MRESALLDLAEAHLQFAHLGGLLNAAQVRDPEFLAALDEGDLLFAQIDHLVGVFDDRRGIGTHKILILPDSDDQRAALAGGNHLVRLVPVHDHQGVSTYDMVQGHRYSLLPGDFPGVHHVLDHLDHDFRVRLALEMVALTGQFRLERLVVFDDAVVDQGQVVVLGVMGV